MDDVLAIILGGGQGSRLFPLTQQRSKPAVPIGGKYRLIDVPISNCLHADLRRIFVLTQFNSASLNHHVAQSYHMDPFSHGFVDIIAAEQTPDSSSWFQGTADAVRQAARHFLRYDADYYLILAGDHLYRMDYGLLLDAHVDQDADITVAALPVTPEDAPGDGHVPLRSRRTDRRLRGEADRERLAAIGSSVPPGGPFYSQTLRAAETVHRVDGHLRVLARRAARAAAQHDGRPISAARSFRRRSTSHRVRAYLHDGYWADVGTVESFYDANIMLTEPHAPFKFYDPRRPIFTHERFLPPSHLRSCTVRESIVADGCFLEECSIEQSVIGIRTHVAQGHAHHALGAARRRHVRVRESPTARHRPRRRARSRHHRQERVDRRRRAPGQRGAACSTPTATATYIRGGIIIVPKGGRIAPGTHLI